MNEEKLNELNKKILDKETQYLNQAKNINEGNLRYSTESLALMASIANEVNESGKPLHSNADKRKLRFDELMRNGHQLSVMKKEIEDDEYALKLLGAEVSFLKREFRIQEILSRMSQ